MGRVEVTIKRVGLLCMQVCAVFDATDEEILKVANIDNPIGTAAGWTTVVREDHEMSWGRPVNCEDYPWRKHYIVMC